MPAAGQRNLLVRCVTRSACRAKTTCPLPAHPPSLAVFLFVVVASLALAVNAVAAGPCLYAEDCSEPCPAENSCYWDFDCDGGMICVADCLPSICVCTGEGWNCRWDCAGKCVPRPTWQGPPAYLITDLGTLGGPVSVGTSLSDTGYVVGSADDAFGGRLAYRWHAGEMTSLGAPAALPLSEAWGVNNHGHAVGIAVEQFGDDPHAILWKDGEIIDLGDFGYGDATAYAINDAGRVVGNAMVEGARHAFLWENGVLYDLSDRLPGAGHAAYDIDMFGRIVGWNTDPGEESASAFILDGDVFRDLGRLGGRFSGAWGVNDFGQVVGKSERDPGSPARHHAFLWDGTELIDLGAIGGFDSSHAWSINNRGEVVGEPAFLYDAEHGVRLLADLLLFSERWYRLTPRDINNSGQIAGDGFHYGRHHAFVMTPLDADFDDDGDTDSADFAEFQFCLTGPDSLRDPACTIQDLDRDGHVDLRDFRAMSWVYTGR